MHMHYRLIEGCSPEKEVGNAWGSVAVSGILTLLYVKKIQDIGKVWDGPTTPLDYIQRL